MLEHTGHAGRAYIYGLMQAGVLEQTRATLDKLVKKYEKLLNTKERYVVYILAIIHMAALLVNHFGILSFDTVRIMDWLVAKAVERKLDNVTATPESILGQFISDFGMECLSVDGAWSARKKTTVLRFPTQRTTMRFEKDSDTLYISQHALLDWLAKINCHARTLAKALEKEGILKAKSKLLTLTAGTELTGARQLVWEIDMGHPKIGGGLRLVEPEIEEEDAKPLSN